MDFRTQYDIFDIITCSGNRYEPSYKLKADKNGVRDLVATGKTDCYGLIQSFADSVDLKLVLERYAKGDITALYRKESCYGDFTNMPTTFAELAQRAIDAENLFNSLPLEVRKEFNHSPSEFFASIGTDRFDKFVAPTVTNPTDTAVVETIPNAEIGGDE